MPMLSPTLAALVMAAGLPVAPVPPIPEVVPVASDADQRLTVAVYIGAQGPFQFLVDTGAQNTVLADGVIGRLGLAVGAQHSVTGVAGTLLVDTISLDGIRVGHRTFSEAVVPLLRADVIRADGILGIDALQGLRVLLDFEHNRLSIGEGRDDHEADGNEIVVTAHRRKGQLIVTHARVDGVDTDVVIDTGTETSIGNLALRRRLTHDSALGFARLVGVTGQEIDAEVSATGML